MKTVYCITYGGGHVAIVDLIAQELRRRSRIDVRILALTTAYRAVVDRYPAGAIRRISDYLALFDDRLDDVLRHGQRLAQGAHDPASGLPRIESIAYLGLSYTDLAADRGEAEAEARYRQEGRNVFLPVQAMKRILEHEKPDVVFSTTSPRCEEAAILAANELGLPTVQVLDLFGELYPLPRARHVVTSDQDSIDVLRSQGVTDSEFHILGQPTFEETARKVAGLDREVLRRKLDLAEETPVLLMATTLPCVHRPDYTIERLLPYPEVCGRLFPILRQVGQATGARVLIRLHPNEPVAAYQPWFNEFPEIVHANPLLDLFESLAVADCVATSYSTVGVQGMFCGKPVVTFRFFPEQVYSIPRIQRPPYRFANDLDELPDLLIETVRNPPPIERPSGTDRSAAERIADLLESLALR